MKVSLKVWASDRPLGPAVGKCMLKNPDLVLDTFGSLWAAIFIAYTNSAADPIVTATLKDTGGVNRTFGVWGDSATNRIFRSASPGSKGTRVGVGTGAVAAARTDFNLQTQVGAWTATSGQATWTSATGRVQFAGSVLLAAGATVTEAGATLDMNDQTTTYRQILIFHDIFAGVVIAAGKFANVAYTLQM